MTPGRVKKPDWKMVAVKTGTAVITGQTYSVSVISDKSRMQRKLNIYFMCLSFLKCWKGLKTTTHYKTTSASMDTNDYEIIFTNDYEIIFTNIIQLDFKQDI